MSREKLIGTVCHYLAIILVILKLTHVISFSWWIVLSPIWIPASMSLMALFYVYMMFGKTVLWKTVKHVYLNQK